MSGAPNTTSEVRQMGIQTPGLQKWGDLVKGIPQVTLAWCHYIFESHNPPSPHPTLIPSSLSYILITIWPPVYTSTGRESADPKMQASHPTHFPDTRRRMNEWTDSLSRLCVTGIGVRKPLLSQLKHFTNYMKLGQKFISLNVSFCVFNI